MTRGTTKGSSGANTEGMKRLCVLILLVAVAGLTAAQAVQPSTALLAQMDDLERYAMRVRGLQRLSPVERLFPTRDAAVAFVAAQLDDPELYQYYLDAELTYKAFDLLAPDADLIAALETLLEEQVGGFYDTETKQMNTLLITGAELSNRLPLLEQIIFVHEFTHALQDQHFDLEAVMASDDIAFIEQYPDQALARLALVEGDATEVMTQFVMLLTEERPAEVMQDMGAIMDMMNTLVIPPGTPRILEAELTFPYVQGQLFIQALLADGGWEAVNEAFEIPPASTEQIINPTKYLAGEQPIKVELADVSAALGAGWTHKYDRTGGEFFLRRVLELHLPQIATIRAAGGWGGDRYRLYVEDNTSATAWAWRLAWDTPEDAAQFWNAIQRWTGTRYGGDAAGGLCWQSDGDATCLAQIEGSLDVVITRAPMLDQAKALREQVTGS